MRLLPGLGSSSLMLSNHSNHPNNEQTPMKAHFHFLSLCVVMLCLGVSSRAQLSGTITVPNTTYPTLASVVTALNSQGVGAGGCTVNLSTGNAQTAPAGGYQLGSATLNASLSASNQLVFNGSGNTITAQTGTGSNDGIWWLMGTDYVTVNGFNLVDNSTTTTSSSTSGIEWGIVLGKRNTSAPYDGCQNVTISNCSISLNKYIGATLSPTNPITSFNFNSNSTGILMAHVTPGSTSLSTISYTAGDANSYNKFTGNTISNVSRGIYMGYPFDLAANLRDIKNQVGGTTAASGNTITVGGTSLTTTLYGIVALSDSSLTVQNNKFYLNSSQTANAAVYMCYIGGNSIGVLNVLNNYFNISSSSNTTTAVGAFYTNAINGTTYGFSDVGGTENIIGNEVTGSNAVATTSALYCFYNYYAYARNVNMNNNYIHDISWATNNGTGSSSNSLYGLYNYNNSITGTFTMNGNRFQNVTRNGPGYIYASYGYQVNSAQGSVFNMKNNLFRKLTTSSTYTTSSSNIYLSYNWANPLTTAGSDMRAFVQNNRFDSMDMTGCTGYLHYVYNYLGYYFGDSSQFTNDTMTNWFCSNVQPFSYYGYFYNMIEQSFGQKGSRVANNIIDNFSGNNAYSYNYIGYYAQYVDSNSISNINIGGNGGTTGYFYTTLGYSQINGHIRGNKVYNISMNTISNPIYIFTGYFGSGPVEIYGNSYRRITSTSTSTNPYYGYYAYGTVGANVHDNIVDSIVMDAHPIYAMYPLLNGGNDTFYNNRVTRLATTNSNGTIYGYYLGIGTVGNQYLFYNNQMAGMEVPGSYNSGNLYGIYTTGNADYKLFNNTVRISPAASVSGSNYGATGIYYSSGSGTLDLRNNIINVNVVPGSSNSTAALRRSSGTTGTPPANFLASSNSNIYYAPNTTNSYLYAEGTSTGVVNAYNLTNDPGFNSGACSAFKNFVGHDQGSFSENNLVASAAVANAYVPTGGSRAEKGATATSNPTVSNDLSGATRGNPADIGSLEFSGTVIDNAAPQIAYVALPGINYCTTQPVLIANITDQIGVNVTTGTKPRLYYKKSTENNAFGGGNTSAVNGWKWVEPTSISGDLYTFTFDYSLLTSAVNGGTTIQYFIIAQDVTANTNTAATVGMFTSCPSSVNLVAANGPLLASPASNSYTVNNPPLFSLSAALNNHCVSGATTISVVPAPYGTTLQWESATLTGPFSPIAAATSAVYQTPLLTATTRYRAILYCGSSVLTTTNPVTVNVSNPQITNVVPASRCGYGQVTLTANPNAGATINWYTSATSTTPFLTGTSFTTPNIGSSVTYYASAVVPKGSTEHIAMIPTQQWGSTTSTSGFGEMFHFSDSVTFYSTTVYPNNNSTLYIELVDDATGNTVRTAGPFTLAGVGGNYTVPTTINLNWTNIPPGEYRLISGSSTPSATSLYYHYYTTAPTFTYPYYSNVTGRAWATGSYYPGITPIPYPFYWFFFFDNVISGPCENPARIPVTATVTPSTSITASSPNSPGICSGSSATVAASSTNGSYLYSWQPGSLSGATQTVSPTTTTTYVVTGTDPLTGCTAVDSVKLFVNPQQPPPVVAPGGSQTICQNSAVQLTATPSTPFGGLATLGTGTLTNGTTGYPTPFGQWFGSSHDQYLVKASELTAAGMGPGSITSIAFDFSSSYSGASLQNYVIRIAPTTQTSVSTTLQCTGFITVYGPASISPSGAGYYTINFSTPFVWNGTDNLMIDIMHSNCSVCNGTASCVTSFTSNGNMNQSSTSYVSSVSYYADNNCTITSCTPSGGNVGTYSQRPNIRFNWGKPYSINWTPNVTGLYKAYPPLFGAMTTADTNSKVWAGPTGTQIYRAVVNAQGCLSNPSNPDTVFVNPAPPTTITPAGPQTICTGNCVTLTAPSGATMTYQWLQLVSAPSTYSVVGTSATYNACAAGTYRVRVLNLATGCFDTSAATVITANALPTASITAGGPTTFCNGGSVVLTATTNASPAAYQWYNGSTPITGATGANYTATASGTYTVVVTNTNQCSQTSGGITVNVNTVPNTITASGPTTFCTGGSVTLSAPTTGTGAPYNYAWYLGASTTPFSTSSSVTVSTSGNYYVVLTSPSVGCNGTSATISVTAGSAPPSAITPASSAILCSNGTLTLSTNPSPGLTYQWNKNGSPIPASCEPTAITANLTVGNNACTGAGSYTVTVTMSSLTSCSSTTSTPTVVTISTAPTSTFSAGGPTTFCAGGSVLLSYTGTTPVTYQWKLNGASVATGGTSSTYSAITSGTYTVTATNSAGCATTSAGTTVTVNPLPNVAITQSGASNICQGGSVTLTATSSSAISSYLWKVNGSPIVPVATGSAYPASATGNYTVTVTDANGCQGTSTPVAVMVNPLPNATTTPSTAQTICQGSTLTMSTPYNVNYSYGWQNASGPIAGATQSSYTTGTAGSYSVKITNNVTGCQATSVPIVLTVTPPPAASVSRSTGAGAICASDSVKLLANLGSGLTYQWNYNGTPVAGATDTILYAKAQGTYTVTVFNGSCSATSPGLLVQVNPSPAAFITYGSALSFCEGTAVVLTANAGLGLAYQWFINDTATTNTSSAFVAIRTGVYRLTTKNVFGCTSTSDTLHITVYPAPDPQIVRTGSDGTILSTVKAYASYQWFLNNTAIGGATSQTYTAIQNGAYKVRVTDSNGCENFSTLTFIQNVGIVPTAVSAAIKVFPNPTSGILHIDAPVKVKLNLRDVTGKTVSEAVAVKEMDITKVASGMYLLYISDMDGKTLRIDKVTKTDN
jgi:hypothetical protein